jgi:hypothetical protein
LRTEEVTGEGGVLSEWSKKKKRKKKKPKK